MAFDWTKVDGYREDMTADEKLDLLNDYTEPEPAPAPTNVISKSQYDKVSSELAAAKKQLRSKMTEDEQREAERKANEDSMREELETLRKEKTISTYKAAYMGQGYDEKSAEEAANAMADNDMDTVFALMKKQAATAEQALRMKILKETPVPPAGNDPETDKNKRFDAMLRESFGLPPEKTK